VDDPALDRLVCPAPRTVYENVLLGHGSGGRMMSDLIRHTFLPRLASDTLAALEDQASLDLPGTSGNRARLAFTTDAFVVRPLFFPGGDIGRLAVHGTVNDLAVGGAHPLFLAAAFILEEGLPIRDLERIATSMREACDHAGVQLVTADTKVVDRGKGDQIYITTTGIGMIPAHCRLSIHAARPGDSLLVSGTVGDHGIAIMSVREGIEFETVLQSDSAPLASLAQALVRACPGLRAMRPARAGRRLARGREVGRVGDPAAQ
jgi:hydrogenase expression/formation protein HypE